MDGAKQKGSAEKKNKADGKDGKPRSENEATDSRKKGGYGKAKGEKFSLAENNSVLAKRTRAACESRK